MLLLALLIAPVHAQTPYLGGFGYALNGMTFSSVVGLGGPLEHALGDGAAPGLLEWQFGGGGKVLAWNFLIGGKGYGTLRPEAHTPIGAVAYGGGGGGLELGYAVVNRQRWLLYPYIGVGGYSLGMRVHNHTELDLQIGDADVAGGESVAFDSSYVMAEWGLGFQRLLFTEGATGGWQLGAEVGFTLTTSSEAWITVGGGEVSGMNRPEIAGGFLRMTIGGGGYFYR